MSGVYGTAQAAIAAGTSLSAAVSLGSGSLVALLMPAALTYQVSVDRGATFSNFYDAAGNEYTTPIAPGQYVAFDPVLFAGINWIKIRSGRASADQPGGRCGCHAYRLCAARLSEPPPYTEHRTDRVGRKEL